MDWLRTLGGFAIERDGSALDRPATHRKSLALLALLAVQGSATRERLMALLWSESDAERARGSLKQAIHLLRRHLGAPDLLLGTAELRLNPERIQSDVQLFLHSLAEGDYASAVRHYGGPFLDGFHLHGAPEFERWTDAERTDLARKFADCLERLARDAEAQGDHALAATWWRRLQAEDLLNSRVALSLMMSLEASGDRAGALRHAEIHQILLAEELGITPDSDVAALTDRLRASGAGPPQRAEPLPAAPPRPPLAPPAPETERAALDEREPGKGGSERVAGVPLDASRQERRYRPALLALIALLAVAGISVALAAMADRTVSDPAERTSGAPFPELDHASVAVLPFLDLSSEGGNQYFSDGMAEELIHHLSRVEGLRVAARASSFQFRGGTVDIREVGSRLGAAHVLTGSVRKAGNRTRISVQLVDARNGYQLWSQTYEREFADVFRIQDEISRAVVEALNVRLSAGAEATFPAAPTANLPAYESYLRGLHFLNRQQIPRAAEYLEEAIRLDPQFARAHAALAEAYAVLAGYSDRPPLQTLPQGVAAARAALRLDPSLAEAHAALGWLEMIDLRWDEAGHSLRRAVELSPRSPRARLNYAIYLHRRGHVLEALEQMGIARRLDPLSLLINALYGHYLMDSGDVHRAVAHLQSVLELEPTFPVTHGVLGHVYLVAGKTDEAILHYERFAELVPTSIYQGALGHAYARVGRIEDARRILEHLKTRSARGDYVSPGAVGWILLGLEERDEGFRWLEQAVEARDVFLTVYAPLASPYLSEPYQADPRFQRLRRRIGGAQ